ncbi:MAG: site-specific integrase [Pirellulales bacterium]|nr:site-specific integrase [Pirellulales bacterium]
MGRPKQEHRIPFSKQRLAALPVPDKGRVYWHDTGQPGLTCCVTEAGTKTYYLYRWVLGHPERIRIAKFGEVSVEQARDEARRLVGEIATGKNPQVERVGRRGEPTIGEAWEHWLADAKLRSRPQSIENAVSKYDLYIRPWEKRRLSTVTADMVARWHSSIGSKTFAFPARAIQRQRGGPAAANHAVILLGAIYTAGKQLGYRGDDPTEGVKRFEIGERERFLQADELGPFLAACESEPEPWCDYWPMCLWTGARRSNVAAMKWRDLDLDRGLWFISGEETKNGKPITLPLAGPSLEILKRRRVENRSGSPWVFPMNHPCGHVPPDLDQHWQRVLDRAGLTGLVPHDLRRTLGSWQALGGSSLQVIGKSLGHARTASTEIYARLQTDPVRISVNGAVEAIMAAAQKPGRKRS